MSETHAARPRPKMFAYEPGDVVGALTVEAATDVRRSGSVVYRCRCRCGRIVSVSGVNLLVHPDHSGCKPCRAEAFRRNHTSARARREAMAAAFAAGGTLADVAARFGVTSQRVRQVVTRLMPDGAARRVITECPADALRAAVLALPPGPRRRVAIAAAKAGETSA